LARLGWVFLVACVCRTCIRPDWEERKRKHAMTTHNSRTISTKRIVKQEREKRKELHYDVVLCCTSSSSIIIIIIIYPFCCCQILQHNCSFLRHYHPVCPILYYQDDYSLGLSNFEAKSPHPNKLFIFPKTFVRWQSVHLHE
jgi:hypothetical protein